MNEEKDLLKRYGRKTPFRVPDGYFENFADRLMQQLPEKESIEEPTVRLWDRVKPWLYMAAMFVGLMFSIRTLISTDPAAEPAACETIAGIPVDDIEPIMDYTLMDDYTLYQYLTEADFDMSNHE